MKIILKRKVKFVVSIIMICFFINLIACGTIMYPERKGQRDGRLDPAIVILDAVGLLFFFIPGVIAFAVDFNNGCIYMSGGKHSNKTINDIKVARFDPRSTSPSDISRLIEQSVGKKVAFTDKRMLVYSMDETKDVRTLVLNANP
jgi:hypothetical protein